jgi:uncharacterized protein YdhG (YjbR/CyaY superfamily)
MEKKTDKYNILVDEYINQFDGVVKEKLNEIRKVIHENAPDATERISYQMPTIFFFRNLVHFAAYGNHIGFYPGSSGIAQFMDRINSFHYSKGTIRFPLDKPLPLDLIGEIVRFRVEENSKLRKGK